MTLESNVGAWARFYRADGLNPLPSRGDRKGPALEKYAHYRDGILGPLEWMVRWPAPNIQLPLGVPWRLLVVDVDGLRALQQWCAWHTLGREWPETWTVATRRGRHFYYRIPDDVATCPSRPIWFQMRHGHRVKDSEIRILADKSLVIAPPSRHVEPPHPVYAFMGGRGPMDLPLAMAPRWLLNCKEFKIASKPKKFVRRFRDDLENVMLPNAAYETIEHIPEQAKLALARSWGLRTASDHPNSKGWICCHALDRPDEHPSASLHLPSGVFWQSGQRAMSFAGLAVALGAARDLRAAFELLGIKSCVEAPR